MPDEMAHVGNDNFQAEVLDAEVPVLVDFTATWCGPCKMLEPVVEQLVQEWAGKVTVVKQDVDHNPEMAMRYQVMGVPTLMLFSGGKQLERVTGFQPKDRLMKKFGQHLGE